MRRPGDRIKPFPPVDLGPSSRVFLYGFFPAGNRPATYAAVGLVRERGFQIVKEFAVDEFPFYGDVYGAARNGKRWLLLLDHRDGKAMTGLVDADHRFVEAYRHPPGSLPHWRHVAVDGEGYLLLAGTNQKLRRNEIALAQVEDDGSVTVWWTTETALPLPNFLVGLPTGHLWVNVDEEAMTSTARVFHRGQPATEQSWNDVWRGVAAQGNLVSLYRAARQLPEQGGTRPTVAPRVLVCSAGADERLTTLSDAGDWSFPLRADTGTDVATPTGMFFVQRAIGRECWGQVRSLTAAGYVPTFDYGTLPVPAPEARAQTHWKVAPC